MIDVRAPNKRLLLQELAAKAAASLAWVSIRLRLTSQAGGNRIRRNRRRRSHSHARLLSLQRPFRLLGETEAPIEFDAIDGQPVDIVFVLLLPANGEDGKPGALALVARTLRSSETLRRLRRARCFRTLFDDSNVMRLCPDPPHHYSIAAPKGRKIIVPLRIETFVSQYLPISYVPATNSLPSRPVVSRQTKVLVVMRAPASGLA